MTDRLREAILAAADAVEAARAELGVLDGVAGDGDHGMTMSTGARNVRRRLEGAPDATGAALVREAALGMASVGGAIGPIYGTGLLRVAALLGDQAVAGAPGRPGLTIELLRRCAQAAEEAVTSLGGAAPGDKTIVDALHPLVVALDDAAVAGEDVPTAIERAVAAAEAGAASTAEMVARIGRASRLGERSRGQPDAGATSFAIVVRAVASAWGDPPAGGPYEVGP